MVRKGAIEGIHFALGWGNSDGPLHWRGVTNHFVAEISFAHTDATLLFASQRHAHCQEAAV